MIDQINSVGLEGLAGNIEIPELELHRNVRPAILPGRVKPHVGAEVGVEVVRRHKSDLNRIVRNGSTIGVDKGTIPKSAHGGEIGEQKPTEVVNDLMERRRDERPVKVSLVQDHGGTHAIEGVVCA